MREILFRESEKSTMNGRKDFCLYPERENAKSSGVILNTYQQKHPKFTPETVGQFTGLTDKNGKKIFEGDVVSYRDEFGVIEYHEGEAMFVVSFDTWLTDFDHICGNSLEIIGNIHDNPELLGGAENG